MNIQCVLTVCAFKAPVSYTNSRMWCDQWRILITVFTFVTHQSFAFTKGCCEMDASMRLSQFLGDFRLQHLKIWQCCTVAWSSHTQQLRKTLLRYFPWQTWNPKRKNEMIFRNNVNYSSQTQCNAVQHCQDPHIKYIYSNNDEYCSNFNPCGRGKRAISDA